ncbi:hypothetical protein GCM10025762_45540 [Haloechinothrix salitolerans]
MVVGVAGLAAPAPRSVPGDVAVAVDAGGVGVVAVCLAAAEPEVAVCLAAVVPGVAALALAALVAVPAVPVALVVGLAAGVGRGETPGAARSRAPSLPSWCQAAVIPAGVPGR